MDAGSNTVSHSQPCISCGYDLVGLQVLGQCPECATPVERSLRGDLLRFSSAEYRGKLLKGVTLIMTGIALSLLSFVLVVAIGFLGAIALVVFASLSLVGSAASYY